MKSFTTRLVMISAMSFAALSASAQVPDGQNEYYLAAVNPRTYGVDADGGRGVWVAHDPDLDGDGKPEILVTDYSGGGRVFAFEVVGDNTLEFIWASKERPGETGPGSTPRTVTTGDLDNDGKQEIIFPLGFFVADSLLRGIHIYEFTGRDNDFGTEPIYRIKFEDIDPAFKGLNVGRTESGLLVQDIDGDGRNELVFPPRALGNVNYAPVLNLYILQVTSGTFEGGDARVEVEYKYDRMAQALGTDGFSPVGANLGDIDFDGKRELVITGWTNVAAGSGLGFLEIVGPDTYEPGSVIHLTGGSGSSIFNVKSNPLLIPVGPDTLIFLHGGTTGTAFGSRLLVVEGIIDDRLVDSSQVKIVMRNTGIFSIWDWGDQDHGPGSDQFDLYASTGARVLDLEWDGVGSVTDSTSYQITEVFNILGQYDAIGGLFNDVFTYPGMDLDKDGAREIVASWKGSADDRLAGRSFIDSTFNIFVFEWGDSSRTIDLRRVLTSVPPTWTLITPEDYKLEQNYPNPFNPTTTIEFTLPLNKTISLKIYNSLGQLVRTLIDNREYAAGPHRVQWDSTDEHGKPVASGTYIYRLEFGHFSHTRMMTLVR